MIARGIEGEARQPGTQGRLATEARQRPPRLQKSLLGDIGGLVGVRRQGVGGPVDLLMVPFQQAAEGAVIPGATPRQQCHLVRVRLVVRHRRPSPSAH